MIKNDKQYQVTKSRLHDFKESLLALEKDETDPLLQELHVGALKSQIEQFEKQILEYELLKEGNTSYVVVDDLSHLHEVLIKARIAQKMTQAELAKSLELKEQQIQRYEGSDYSTASMSRIIEVSQALGLKIEKLKIKVKEAFFAVPSGIDENKLAQIRTDRALLKL